MDQQRPGTARFWTPTKGTAAGNNYGNGSSLHHGEQDRSYREGHHENPLPEAPVLHGFVLHDGRRQLRVDVGVSTQQPQVGTHVTYSIATSDPTEAVVTGGDSGTEYTSTQLVFTEDNWDMGIPITVMGKSDSTLDGDIEYTVDFYLEDTTTTCSRISTAPRCRW